MMGDSHIRIGASMARPPWTILVVIVLAALLPLSHIWWTIDTGFYRDVRGAFGWTTLLLELLTAYVVVALLAHGLWRGSRFVHIAAIVWQLSLVGRAADGLRSNVAWSLLWSTDHGLLYVLGLPALVGVVSLVLLCLPSTWSWTSHQQRLRRL